MTYTVSSGTLNPVSLVHLPGTTDDIVMKLTIQPEKQAPVCERRDDESLGAAEIFVHVCEVDVGDRHHALVVVFNEVKP